jgi:hypothetical protein
MAPNLKNIYNYRLQLQSFSMYNIFLQLLEIIRIQLNELMESLTITLLVMVTTVLMT